MRGLKMLSIAVTAVFAVVIAVATAQAAEAKLEFLPIALEFKVRNFPMISTVFRTLGGKRVVCSGVTGVGQATSKRLGTLELVFTGCEEPQLKVKCTGLLDKTTGSITIAGHEGEGAEFHLRHLLGMEVPTENVDFVILVEHVHFSCSLVLFLVLGCVASDDILTLGGVSAVNKLAEDLLMKFLERMASSGDPAVSSIDSDSSLAMETCELRIKEGAAAYESSSMSGEDVIEGCVSDAKGCTLLIDLSGVF